MNFELTSAYSPTGDQPEAIAALSEGVKGGIPFQTLLGVTGSGSQCDPTGAAAYFDIES